MASFEAEAYLDSLEPLGVRFGLERIRKLVTALGLPQHRFASLHVVGTNGKSSVTEITAALIEADGLRTGAYLSPHSERWAERVRIRGDEIAADAFAAAVEKVSLAVEGVNRSLPEDEAVTQFEAATAAAFVALADARVELGVIEAGVGGRLDATNVIPSKVTVLTSIGLEHTQWLGDTELEIAAEKLAVLRDHTTLVHGALSDEVAELARVTAAERHCRVIAATAGDGAHARGAGFDSIDLDRAPYLRHNFSVAVAATEAALARPLERARVEAALGSLELHGRMEVIGGDPPVVLDAAHNPDGARALAEALPAVAAGRPVIACIAVLADKDADAMLDALAPLLEVVVATTIPPERLERGGRPGAEAMPAHELAKAALRAGVGQVEPVDNPLEAVERARALARPDALLLVCGSHYLLGYAN